MSGTFGRNVNSDVKKIGIFGARAISVGILGAPYFRNFGSPKIRKNGSAPSARVFRQKKELQARQLRQGKAR